MKDTLTTICSKKELVQLHRTWKKGKKDLQWWKNETGLIGVNIRKYCQIPLPHPDSVIQIACVYILQLDFIARTNREPAIFKHRAEVFEILKQCCKEYNIPILDSDDGKFPWLP